MKKNNETGSSGSLPWESVCRRIHEKGYTDTARMMQNDKDLYEALVTAIYDLTREKLIRTKWARGTIDSYHKQYNDHNIHAKIEVETENLQGEKEILLKDICYADGDIVQSFIIKILRPVSKGENKGTYWLDHLLIRPCDEWEQYLQTALNNHVKDLFKTSPVVSLDAPLLSGEKDTEKDLTLGDSITKHSPCEASYSLEDTVIAAEEIKDIICLLRDALDLVVFADKYANAGRCLGAELYEELKKINDPVRSVIRALRTLLPELSPAEFRSFCYRVMPGIRYSSIKKLLEKDPEEGRSALRHRAERVKKIILEGSEELQAWVPYYSKKDCDRKAGISRLSVDSWKNRKEGA